MGVPSAGFEAHRYNNLHFQGRNTLLQAFFGGSAAVGKTRRRKASYFRRAGVCGRVGVVRQESLVDRVSWKEFTL
jgi:hypothetical protein